MSTQKGRVIKISKFDKDNYSQWKMKLLLFIKTANPLYIDILTKGPFVPQQQLEATIVGTSIVLAHHVPKDPFKWTHGEK